MLWDGQVKYRCYPPVRESRYVQTHRRQIHNLRQEHREVIFRRACAHELIAAHNSIEEIANYIGADSLTYLSIDGLLNSIKAEGFDYCTACFTGDYPIGRGTDKYALEE